MKQSTTSINYQELGQHLAVSDLSPSAAEAQGILCALLCVGERQAEEVWIAELLAGTDDTTLSARECRLALGHVAAFTREGFSGSEIGFRLLLPDDSAPLAERALGLYDWSRGFLYGLGLAGVETKRLTEQAKEACDDLAAITHLDLDDLESDEYNEQSLMELTEFVRVAAMLVYEEQGGRGMPIQ